MNVSRIFNESQENKVTNDMYLLWNAHEYFLYPVRMNKVLRCFTINVHIANTPGTRKTHTHTHTKKLD